MLALLKRWYWDLKDPALRFNYWNTLLRQLAGGAGIMLRRRFIVPHFRAAGERIEILEGVRFRGVQGLTVGSDCHIGVDNFLQASGGITLGDGVMLGPGVKIWSLNHVFEDTEVPIPQQGYESEPVEVGDGCWLGANVFVFPGVRLPEGCVVSAGSVLAKKKYPPWSVIAGYPARVIGNRRPKPPKPPKPPEPEPEA